MNVLFNLKEPQLKGVLGILAKTGDTRDITINIKDEESQEKAPGLTSTAGEGTEEEQEKEGEAKEEASEETTW
jgi:hypothetical protein